MNAVNPNDCLFLIIDVQEKLVKMLGESEVSKNAVILSNTAGILNLPVIITEQYPKGLGSTISEIKNSLPQAVYKEKTCFSAFSEGGFPELIKETAKHQIILFGIETHICVLQTAFDLLENGYEVFVVKDASGSRTKENHETALERLRHNGAQIVTSEMVIFELLKSSKHPNFKEVQSLIK